MTPPPTKHLARGFTLIEVLIVLLVVAIIATLVIPSYTGASQPARENALRETVRVMRTQIELFTGRHNGLPPGYPNGDRSATPTATAFVEQMTRFTSETGATSEVYTPGTPIKPCFTSIPVNPFNNLDAVRIVGDAEAMPAVTGATYGWYFKPASRQLVANTPGTDSEGRAFSDY